MAEEFKFGKNDAGNKFSGEPYVKPDTNDNNNTYEDVRGDDLSTSAAKNSNNLQYTRDQTGEDYLRLLMPKYTRRVEVEDLNRNFWVIGQALNSVGKNIKTIGDSIININNIERTHFEITKEKDRDNKDYSNYPHKIIFNEGIDGIKTPFMVKDYCYRSDESSTNFENDCLWSRQIGGYNSADHAYKIGSYGTIPFLNFYKPRPDAIPIFSLVQTESSDTETHSTESIANGGGDEVDITGHRFLGRANTMKFSGSTVQDGGVLSSASDFQNKVGDIIIANVLEITPIRGTLVDPNNKQSSVIDYNGTSQEFEVFLEGQIIITDVNDFTKTKVKVEDTTQGHSGFVLPKTYKWQDFSTADSLALNYVDQKFMWTGGYWKSLDQIVYSDGPIIPQYQVVENGSIFRVLGDTDDNHEITDGSTTHPTINGKVFPDDYPGAGIRNHDVVRNKSNGLCFEWWNGAWRQIHNCDAAYVNIFIWFPQKTSTLRSVYYWTLKWLIPPGLGEY